MNEATLDRAERLELLLPRVLRALGRPEEPDPLSGLSIAQLRLVRLLFATDRTPSSISEELGLSLSAVTQMANRLERAGLIERVLDPEDRRLKRLRLTPHGLKLMRRRHQQRVSLAARFLSNLPEARQDEVLAALTELADACECPLGRQTRSRAPTEAAEKAVPVEVIKE